MGLDVLFSNFHYFLFSSTSAEVRSEAEASLDVGDLRVPATANSENGLMPAWPGFFPCSHGVRLERLPSGFTDFQSRGEESGAGGDGTADSLFFMSLVLDFWGSCRGARGRALVSYYLR